MKKLFIVPALAALLSGCVTSNTAPSSIYDLSVSRASFNVSGSTNSQILITEPKVISTLDTERVLVKETPTSVAYYGDVRWADRAPKLVQLEIARAFDRTGGARAVGLPGDGLIIDHQILLDLRAFQAERIKEGFGVHVELAARLMNDRNGRIVSSKSFEAFVPVSDGNPELVIQGMDQALANVVEELMNWTFEKI